MPNLGWDELIAAAGDAGKEFEPLFDGNYNFVIAKTEMKESKTGKTGINITAIVESGPDAKRRIWHTWWISPDSPAALAYFFREMALFGLTQEFWASKPSDEAIIAGLNNKRFVGTLTTQEYQGKKSNNISKFLAPVGAATGNAAATLGTSGGASGGPSAGPTVAAASGPSAGPAAPVAAAPSFSAPPAAPATTAPPAPAAATPPPAAPGPVAAPVTDNPWENPPAAPQVTATPPAAVPPVA